MDLMEREYLIHVFVSIVCVPRYFENICSNVWYLFSFSLMNRFVTYDLRAAILVELSRLMVGV